MPDADQAVMTAKTVAELELWTRAISFWKGANALLDRPAFARDWKLRNKLRDATDSVLSNIAKASSRRRTGGCDIPLRREIISR